MYPAELESLFLHHPTHRLNVSYCDHRMAVVYPSFVCQGVNQQFAQTPSPTKQK